MAEQHEASITALAPVGAGSISYPASLAAYAADVADRLARAQRPNTRRTYGAGWRAFVSFCVRHELASLPASPETVALFLSAAAQGEHRAGGRPLKSSTLTTYLAAIRDAHRGAGLPSPTEHPAVSRHLGTVADDERAAGTHRPDQVAPLLAEQARAIIDVLDTRTLAGARDAVVILVGLVGGFRRAELSRLEVADLEWHGPNVRIWVRQSKTSAKGDGVRPGVDYKDLVAHPSSPYCPVRALRRWLELAGVESGPVFRTFTMSGALTEHAIAGRDVARTVKRCVALIGLDAGAYSGHSLRAGFVTEHALRDHDNALIKTQTGHSDDRTVERYKRRHVAFRHDHAALLGLTS